MDRLEKVIARTTFALAALAVTISVAAVARAAQDAGAMPDLFGMFRAAWAAYQQHAYVLLGAIVVGAVLAVAKAGWFGAWFTSKIPAKWRPVVGFAVALLGMMATEVQNGGDWRAAILHALEAAALAVFGHQTLVEGMRSGRELVPAAPWAAPPTK